jgi:general L-amino acid transport system substrate-binding protein
VVRHGDDQWLDIVKWTLYAMLEAEELGVSSKNAKKMRGSKNPNIKRLLGQEGDLGKNLGLDEKWAYNIIRQVGNYGESYAKHVGPNTPLKLSRGVNALWSQGGLQYAMPVR